MCDVQHLSFLDTSFVMTLLLLYAGFFSRRGTGGKGDRGSKGGAPAWQQGDEEEGRSSQALPRASALIRSRIEASGKGGWADSGGQGGHPGDFLEGEKGCWQGGQGGLLGKGWKAYCTHIQCATFCALH